MPGIDKEKYEAGHCWRSNPARCKMTVAVPYVFGSKVPVANISGRRSTPASIMSTWGTGGKNVVIYHVFFRKVQSYKLNPSEV